MTCFPETVLLSIPLIPKATKTRAFLLRLGRVTGVHGLGHNGGVVGLIAAVEVEALEVVLAISESEEKWLLSYAQKIIKNNSIR